jgi:hypothetical protein
MGAYRYASFSNIASGNHVYNNVITGISVGGTPLHLGENGTGGKCFENIFKNNIIYNNGGTWYQTKRDGSWPRETINQQMKVQVSPYVRDNVFVNNIFYKTGATRILWVNNGYYSVEQAQISHPALYIGNLQTDPLLDPETQRPLANSPVKDAGAPLTTITSPSGSGKTIKVDDAYYFSPGFGLVTGDSVQIRNQVVTIKSINYATNTLILASPISWNRGDAVNLPYSGTAPDIGAYESVSSTVQLSPPADRPAPSADRLSPSADQLSPSAGELSPPAGQR